jgi:hypothetical protein
MPTILCFKSNLYTSIPLEVLQNNKLTLESRGLFSLILSLIDQGNVTVERLLDFVKEDEEKVMGLLKELESHNLLRSQS